MKIDPERPTQWWLIRTDYIDGLTADPLPEQEEKVLAYWRTYLERMGHTPAGLHWVPGVGDWVWYVAKDPLDIPVLERDPDFPAQH